MPTVAELAERYSARLAGRGDVSVSGFATLSDASPHQLAFLANSLYRQTACESSAGAIILSEKDYDFVNQQPGGTSRSYLITSNPYALYARIAQSFVASIQARYAPGIHSSAVISPSAKISPSAHIGPFCFVGDNAVIGDSVVLVSHVHIGTKTSIAQATIIHPNATIYDSCDIGKRCVIHAGVSIGADGFGYAPDFSAQGGEWLKVPQVGRVLIGDDVDIGANTCIDRGALSDTIIEHGCKIDNLVQVAHNVKIGAFTVIAGCAAISGSTTIGKMCIIGGAANFAGHLHIADQTTISGNTSVMKSIESPKQHFTSVYPMLPHAEWEKNAAIARGLDKMRAKLKALEAQIKLLINQKS